MYSWRLVTLARSPAGGLTVHSLAKVAHLRERQFSLVFYSETGLSPAKAVEKLQLETAGNTVERGNHRQGHGLP